MTNPLAQPRNGHPDFPVSPIEDAGQTRTRCDASGEAPPGSVRFQTGRILFQGNVTLRLRTEEVLTALRRHRQGDWGDLLPEDAIANDLALEQGGRLLSAYGLGRDRFWIITESDRSVTTVLMAEDG